MKRCFHNSLALLAVLQFCIFSPSNAQQVENKSKWLEKISVTPQIGMLHSWSDFRADGLMPGFLKLDENKLGINVLLNYQLSKVFRISGGMLTGELEGQQNSIKTTGALNEPRDLGFGIYFNTKLLEVTLPRIDVNLTRLIFQDKVKLFDKLSVNFHVSHGLVYYNAKIYSIQDDVNLLYGKRRGRTGETVEAVTSFGMNISYRVSNRFDIGIETSIRNVWNDKLDAWVTPGSANDKYSFTSFGITYHLKKRKEKIEDFLEQQPSILANNDSIFGLFTYKKLPSINHAIAVFNTDGVAIDTIYTDSEGKFIYSKLQSDSEVSFAPVSPDDNDLKEYELQLKTTQNNELQHFVYDKEEGHFVKYRKLAMQLDSTAIDPSLKFKEVDLDDETIFGHFDYKELPMANQALIVMDQDGVPIDTLYTDTEGNFEYSRLKGDMNISFIPLLSDDFDMEEIELELKTNKSAEMEQLVYDSKQGLFVNYKKLSMQRDSTATDPTLIFIEEELDIETFFGHFALKEIPMADQALIVIDEDGVPIDTLYTDSKGNFEYSKLGLDNGFTIIPLNLKDEELKDLNLYVSDASGKKIKQVNRTPQNNAFVVPKRTPSIQKNIVQPIGSTIVKDGLTIYEGGGNFVVVAAFRGLKGSQRKVDELMKQGIEAMVTRNLRDTWYLIALSRFDDKEIALQKMRKARVNGFNDAWVGIK